MIPDWLTNKVYFSGLLKTNEKYRTTYIRIKETLDNHGVDYGFLDMTKDIWARDYMPVQVNLKKFVEFRYDPDYLQAKKYRKLKSYPDLVCSTNDIPTRKTDLIIDGGNVIKSNSSVIMTDKVISENLENYKRDAIVGKLMDLFETDRIAIIPWDKKNDIFGHADGMLRFIDNQTVLIQGYYDEYDDKFKEQLFGELNRIGISWKKMNISQDNGNINNWAYLNFLQTSDIILIPRLGHDDDNLAIQQIKRHYNNYRENQIDSVDMSEVVEEGGALNCISWTIKL